MRKNKCGDCRACCEVLSIEMEKRPSGEDYLAKPAYKRCGFAKPRGTNSCTIYADRPKVCSDFQCGWLKAGWNRKLKPSKSGLMTTIQENENKAGEFALCFYECVPGAWKRRSQRFAEIIQRTLQIPMRVAIIEYGTGKWKVFTTEAICTTDHAKMLEVLHLMPKKEGK